MGHRLSRIYTRTGDDGSTGLGDGVRVPKEHLRVEAYGTVDEANSAIGVVLATPGLPAPVRECLTDVQHDLFDLGGELCMPGYRVIGAGDVERLEQALPLGLDREGSCLPVGVRGHQEDPPARVGRVVSVSFIASVAAS